MSPASCRPLRTAGGRWAGRPGSLPPSGWTAIPPGRAPHPGRRRGNSRVPWPTSAYLSGICEGDRRGSNPRPSEPQSADTCFRVLPIVAESAYLGRFICWWLPVVSGWYALSGVSSGVNAPSYAAPTGRRAAESRGAGSARRRKRGRRLLRTSEALTSNSTRQFHP
jgi:hypothetical protein